MRSRDADRIEKRAEGLGWQVADRHTASTGSIYLDLERAGREIKVRVADHAEAYPPTRGVTQLDVSPGGLTVRQAIDYLSRPETDKEALLQEATIRYHKALAAYHRTATRTGLHPAWGEGGPEEEALHARRAKALTKLEEAEAVYSDLGGAV